MSGPEPFWDIAVATEAESVVIETRVRELAEQSARGWRRVPAAKGRLTRAQRDGDAGRIAAAAEHLRQVQDEADRIGEAAITEMQAATGRGIANLGRLIDAMGQVMPECEAGQ